MAKLPDHLKIKLPQHLTQEDYRKNKIVPIPNLPDSGTKSFQLLISREWLIRHKTQFLICLLELIKKQHPWLLGGI